MRLYGKPAYIRSGNGAEFTATAMMRWLRDQNVGPAYIKPGSPWQNGAVEGFNGKLRETKVVIESGAASTTTSGPTAPSDTDNPPLRARTMKAAMLWPDSLSPRLQAEGRRSLLRRFRLELRCAFPIAAHKHHNRCCELWQPGCVQMAGRSTALDNAT
jgi:transposase InsO family protein